MWAAVSLSAAVGLLAAQPASGLSMEVLSLVMLAPGVGAAAAWLVTREYLPRFGSRSSTGGFLGSIGLSLLAVAVCFATVAIYRGALPEFPAHIAGTPVVLMIAAQAVGALTEELGFRGVLLHSLATRLPRFVAALVTGLLFGVWHVQYLALPLPQYLAFAAGAVALTILMAHVMVGSLWQRMVACTVIHLGGNLAVAFVGGDRIPMTVFGASVVIACLVVAPLAVLLRRGAR